MPGAGTLSDLVAMVVSDPFRKITFWVGTPIV